MATIEEDVIQGNLAAWNDEKEVSQFIDHDISQQETDLICFVELTLTKAFNLLDKAIHHGSTHQHKHHCVHAIRKLLKELEFDIFQTQSFVALESAFCRIYLETMIEPVKTTFQPIFDTIAKFDLTHKTQKLFIGVYWFEFSEAFSTAIYSHTDSSRFFFTRNCLIDAAKHQLEKLVTSPLITSTQEVPQ